MLLVKKFEQENKPPPGSEQVRLAGKDPIKAFSKLMEMRKFYETIVQLNEAVSQKAKLAEKLIKIRVQVDVAKSMKQQMRERSRESRDPEQSRGGCDLSRADPADLQIVCCEAEVQSQSEQVRDSNRSQLYDVNDKLPKLRMESMNLDEEMAILSGVTLSDRHIQPGEVLGDDSRTPVHVSCNGGSGAHTAQLQDT